MSARLSILLFSLFAPIICVSSAKAAEWPALPEANGAIEIPAQEWPQNPGPRTVKIEIHYPQGKLANV